MGQSKETFTAKVLVEKYAVNNNLPESGDSAGICLKKATIHHERSRAIAEFLWSMEPELTIEEMARRTEIIKFGCEGQEYDVRTVCRWLANLKEYRRPGRPRKKNASPD